MNDFVCPKCKQLLDSEGAFRAHFSAYHLFYAPYWCSYCRYRLCGVEELVYHIQKKHPEFGQDYPINCSLDLNHEKLLDGLVDEIVCKSKASGDVSEKMEKIAPKEPEQMTVGDTANCSLDSKHEKLLDGLVEETYTSPRKITNDTEQPKLFIVEHIGENEGPQAHINLANAVLMECNTSGKPSQIAHLEKKKPAAQKRKRSVENETGTENWNDFERRLQSLTNTKVVQTPPEIKVKRQRTKRARKTQLQLPELQQEIDLVANKLDRKVKEETPTNDHETTVDIGMPLLRKCEEVELSASQMKPNSKSVKDSACNDESSVEHATDELQKGADSVVENVMSRWFQTIAEDRAKNLPSAQKICPKETGNDETKREQSKIVGQENVTNTPRFESQNSRSKKKRRLRMPK